MPSKRWPLHIGGHSKTSVGGNKMKKRSSMRIALITVLSIYLLSIIVITGTTTSWGKVEVTDLAFASGDGDKVHVLLYKPKDVNENNKAPLAILAHGGSDMLEQTSGYAIELSRRGIRCFNVRLRRSSWFRCSYGRSRGKFRDFRLWQTRPQYDLECSAVV